MFCTLPPRSRPRFDSQAVLSVLECAILDQHIVDSTSGHTPDRKTMPVAERAAGDQDTGTIRRRIWSCIGINNSIGFQADVVVSDADIAVRDRHIV